MVDVKLQTRYTIVLYGANYPPSYDLSLNEILWTSEFDAHDLCKWLTGFLICIMCMVNSEKCIQLLKKTIECSRFIRPWNTISESYKSYELELSIYLSSRTNAIHIRLDYLSNALLEHMLVSLLIWWLMAFIFQPLNRLSQTRSNYIDGLEGITYTYSWGISKIKLVL